MTRVVHSITVFTLADTNNAGEEAKHCPIFSAFLVLLFLYRKKNISKRMKNPAARPRVSYRKEFFLIIFAR